MSVRDALRVDVDALEATRVVLAVVIGFLTVAPILYGLSISFRPSSEVFGAVHLIPNHPTVEPWRRFVSDAARNLVNSAIIAVGVSALTLFVAVPGAYAFARKRFAGRKTLFYVIIMIMLVPEVMLVVPVLSVWREVGLYDTFAGLWLALVIGAMPISIWILRDNFQKIPPNAEEAAMVYGCTEFSAFLRVVLPLATPAIVAVAFLTFLGAWNNFLFTNLITTSTGPRPAIVVLFSLLAVDRAVTWPYVMAGTFVVGIPPAVFYLLAHRYLERALDF